MMTSLIGLAAQVGAPLIEGILTRRLGDAKGQLVSDVLTRIAQRAGVPVGRLEEEAEAQPEVVREAVREVEAMTPELIALHAAALERQHALMAAEHGEPAFAWAWRPATMWLLGLLWAWNTMVVHLVNHALGSALPVTDLPVLFQLTAIYMGLYMGGHTVKDWVAKRHGT